MGIMVMAAVHQDNTSNYMSAGQFCDDMIIPPKENEWRIFWKKDNTTLQ